jgi:very-short-patch-repair endonuclease
VVDPTTDVHRATDWKTLAARAERHHGLVSRAQAGLSTSSWHRAIASGRLVAIHPDVARFAGAAPTIEQSIAAAVLAVGSGAVASHRSAAHLIGVPGVVTGADDPPHVLLPSRRRRRIAGVVVHRPTDRGHLTPQRTAGIAHTNVLRTLVDLGAAAPGHLVRDAVGHALTHRLVLLQTLETVLVEHSRQGRHGVVALRAAIDHWTIDAKPADSLLEAAMARLVRRHDLPPVEFHPQIERWTPDFRVIGTPILLECDGWRYHGLDRSGFERDRERDAVLVAAGWIVLRFTYRAITGRSHEVANRIRAAVDRWT